MRRGRTLAILAGILILVGLAYAGARIIATRESNQDSGTAAIQALRLSGDITAISYAYKGESLSLLQNDGTWQCTENKEAPISTNITSVMTSTLSEIDAVRALTTQEREPYGLDNPTLTVTAYTSAGERATLHFGDTNAETGDVYLLVEGDDTVYTVSSDVFKAFAYSFLDLIKMDSMPSIDETELQSLDISRDSLNLELTYQADGSPAAYEDHFTWFIGEPYDTLTAADTTKAGDLFYDIAHLYLYRCATYQPTDADLAAAGLDTPVATVKMTYTATATLSDGSSSKVQQTATLEIGDTNEDGYTYVRISGGDMILLANETQCQSIAYASASSLLPDDICLVSMSSVTAMTLTDSDGAAQFALDHADDGTTACRMDGDSYDTDAMTAFFTALNGLTSAATAPDTELSALGDPVYQFTFTRTRTGFETMRLLFYAYKDDSGTEYYLVSFNGRQNQLISRSSVDTMVSNLKNQQVPSVDPDA